MENSTPCDYNNISCHFPTAWQLQLQQVFPQSNSQNNHNATTDNEYPNNTNHTINPWQFPSWNNMVHGGSSLTLQINTTWHWGLHLHPITITQPACNHRSKIVRVNLTWKIVGVIVSIQGWAISQNPKIQGVRRGLKCLKVIPVSLAPSALSRETPLFWWDGHNFWSPA